MKNIDLNNSMLDEHDKQLMEKVTVNEERVQITLPQDHQCKLKLRSIFEKTEAEIEEPYCLMILNQKIDLLPKIFEKLWESCSLRVCADGGASALYDFNPEYIPHYVIGDFDSLRTDVRDYYSKKGAIVIRQRSQFSNDLSKAMSLVKLSFLNLLEGNYVDRSKPNNGINDYNEIHVLDHKHSKEFHEKVKDFKIICINAMGGRLDQTMQNIAHFYHEWLNVPGELGDTPKLIFVTSSDIVFKVPKGGFLIDYDPEFYDEAMLNCGLLPIGEANVTLKTVGLKWDVVNWPASVTTGRVSSSNRFSNIDGCYVNMEKDIIMNIELDYEKLSKII